MSCETALLLQNKQFSTNNDRLGLVLQFSVQVPIFFLRSVSSRRVRLFECRCRRRCDSRTPLSSQPLTAGRVDSPASAAARQTSGTSYCGGCVGD